MIRACAASHETIYQPLYARAEGGLRRKVAATLRTGRAVRMPYRKSQRRMPRDTHPVVMINQRPAEVVDRRVGRHWEGGLILGKDGASAIGTLVERSTRYVKLIHLPHGRSATVFGEALTAAVSECPEHMRGRLTRDQGPEIASHHTVQVALGMPVYFCHPASPWQRGSNENTNGLPRQYFPKGTDLSVHNRHQLDVVAGELNARPVNPSTVPAPATP